MADSKITALTALTSADPANDMIPIVDVSDTPPASGNTKRISINNILAASGTATLASATITGDLTVDTSTLKVDSANNRVGIGTATPVNTLEVVAPAGDNIVSTFRSGDATAANNAGGGFRSISSATAANRVAQVWLDADGANFSGGDYFYIQKNGNSGTVEFNQSSNAAMTFLTNSTERMRIDSSGNVGIGVTPSAWNTNYKGLVVGGSGGNGITIAGNDASIGTGYYLSGVGTYARDNGSATASSINMYNRAFVFRTAAAGAVNSAITWTDAMTLDASGNLLVGTTSSLAAWATKLTLSTNTGTTKWAVGPYADPNNFIISASGSFGVYLNGTSATSWTGISDERLKDIIEPISNAVSKVGSLRSVIGKFKNDETNTRRSFLIAQDVQAVLPEAVDASNPDRLGVAYTDVIPLLVAAIKELTARVQTLEAK